MLPQARRVRVTLRAPRDEALSRLSSLAGVRSVEPVGKPANGSEEFDIDAEEGTDVRDAVFDLAAASGWKLRSMTRFEPTVEDIFRHLTAGNRRSESA
jgi:hypothetical protein